MGWSQGMRLACIERSCSSCNVISPAMRRYHRGGFGPDGTQEKQAVASAKQKVFLKYIGAEFDEAIGRERAALVISDALENPKLQSRIRKWHDEKLRMHADVFQDEIDFRKANRANRYLERVQSEGAGVLKDVTKAHVQVLVESLDKRHPGWESEPESALWDTFSRGGEHSRSSCCPHTRQTEARRRIKSRQGCDAGMAVMAGVAPAAPATGTLARCCAELSSARSPSVRSRRPPLLAAIARPGAAQTAAAPGKKETPPAPTRRTIPRRSRPGNFSPSQGSRRSAGNPPAPAPAAPGAPALNADKPVAP